MQLLDLSDWTLSCDILFTSPCYRFLERLILVTREEQMLVDSVSCALTFAPQALPPDLVRPPRCVVCYIHRALAR